MSEKPAAAEVLFTMCTKRNQELIYNRDAVSKNLAQAEELYCRV